MVMAAIISNGGGKNNGRRRRLAKRRKCNRENGRQRKRKCGEMAAWRMAAALNEKCGGNNRNIENGGKTAAAK